MKKENNDNFDVPIGSFFGEELCDLKGLYVESNLKHLFNHNEIGHYRDDSLATINRKNNQELERLSKNTIKILKELRFKIKTEIGTTEWNFLDISLDFK